MPSVAPPNSVATGSPATCPAMSQSATSSGQYRPAWKSIVSRTRTWRAMASGSSPDEQVLVRLEAVHRVARPDADDALVGLDPDDRDREAVRGTGSQAAGNGGSSGIRRRWSRIAVMRMASQYRPRDPMR